MLPRFRLSLDETADAVFGSLSSTGIENQTWVNDGWPAFLVRENQLARGVWERKDLDWRFRPSNARDAQVVRRFRCWVVLDSYWGERAELALDLERDWVRKRFESYPAVRFSDKKKTWWRRATAAELDGDVPKRAELVEDGWDHEHCAICWETIAAATQPEGYHGEARDTWV